MHLFCIHFLTTGSYEVRLVGGPAPNAGRVEAKFDGNWANVCYDPKHTGTEIWDFNNVEVLCQELGYPGALMAKQGGFGNGERTYYVKDYNCMGGKKFYGIVDVS